MEIKLWSNPKIQYETKMSRRGNIEKCSKPVTYDFKPGVTMLIGSNGTGKSTLLKQLNSLFKERNWNQIPDNDNIRDKYYCYSYDNVYEEKFAKDSWIHSDMKIDRIAATFCNSEGQDMYDYLYYKIADIGKAVRYARSKEYNGIFILFDGLDSGLSLDRLEEIKRKVLDFMVREESKNGEFEVYIVCAANSFEFCSGYDCIDVTNQEHYYFDQYWEFRRHFIKED